ncbi:hypothetical protein JVT61DRAFT_5400 [Boletus reticuloceps]|uniref:Uncharacterized protein n=1 Tax=Boletus reticuloceps TaxID=495285 RepID=A0A8I3AFY4_9AGAM|nr:hypothetical protein JVT61DRAFT_5400 [Boletus reticuloceps]
MSQSPPRLSLPSSSEEFALPSSKANVSPLAEDGPASPLLLRFRRPSLLPKSSNYYAEKRIYSPLAISFTMSSTRRGSTNGEESESDRERMHTESSPSSSSGNPTPPIAMPYERDTEQSHDENDKEPLNPSTPPSSRNLSVLDNDSVFSSTTVGPKRLTYPLLSMAVKLKPPRILNLLAESRPEENEFKSEAAFQRLLASCSDLPLQPRTPRAPSDRGRYPEEVGDEELHEEGSPSDDDDDVDAIFVLDPQGDHMVAKPCTPAHSVNGDDLTSLMGSPMVTAMDVDAVRARVFCAATRLMFFLAVGIAIDHFNPGLGALAVHTSSNNERSPLE